MLSGRPTPKEHKTSQGYKNWKKLLVTRASSDVYKRELRDRLDDGTETDAEWDRSHWKSIWAGVEKRCRTGDYKKRPPGTTDWLLIGIAVSRDWHIATTERGKEFEFVKDRIISFSELQQIANLP